MLWMTLKFNDQLFYILYSWRSPKDGSLNKVNKKKNINLFLLYLIVCIPNGRILFYLSLKWLIIKVYFSITESVCD